ncbi:MAG TPA: hypothetical protein VER17_16700 [Tepidisphaeraceae bacterium]|nr:hypothetical protein [Tepidisphaeraceae bacterium]
MHRTHLAVALVLAASVPLSGCGPKKSPTRATTQPNPQPAVMTDVTARMSELQRRARELAEVGRQLPGRNPQEDRQLVVSAFERSSAALQLLGGPEPGGAFRQQLRIIDNTRQQIQSAADGAPADASVDTGLRSVYNALVSVRERLFPNEPNVQQQLDAVRDRLADLDEVRGPLHSLVVSQVFSRTAQVVDTMAGELEGRNAAAAAHAQQPPQ